MGLASESSEGRCLHYLERRALERAFQMKVQEIASCVYPVKEMPRARKFYEEILGLKATMDHEMKGAHCLEHDIGAGTQASGVAPGMEPSKGG